MFREPADPLLEVIALDPVDARHARDGGADRIELVSDMAAAGLSPSAGTVEAVRSAVDLPVRVMLRLHDGFAAGDLDTLRRTAKDLRSAGAEAFVFGFLDAHGRVDLPVVYELLDVLEGAPWTFHRAIDHSSDRAGVWHALGDLPGLDTVLTAGSPSGLGAGLPVVLADAATRPGRILAGGGLRETHLGPLRAAGVTAVHAGSAIRVGGDWQQPVDPERVRQLRTAVDSLV